MSLLAVSSWWVLSITCSALSDEVQPRFRCAGRLLCEVMPGSATEAAAVAFRELGTRVVILRFGLILGNEGLLARLRWPFRLGLGGRLGSGEQWMSWIHVEDAVRLVEFVLADDAVAGVLNATAPEPVTNRAFTETLGKVLRRPTPVPVPAVVLRTLLGRMADELLLSGQRVIPERAGELGFSFRYPALEPALGDALRMR